MIEHDMLCQKAKTELKNKSQQMADDVEAITPINERAALDNRLAARAETYLLGYAKTPIVNPPIPFNHKISNGRPLKTPDVTELLESMELNFVPGRPDTVIDVLMQPAHIKSTLLPTVHGVPMESIPALELSKEGAVVLNTRENFEALGGQHRQAAAVKLEAVLSKQFASATKMYMGVLSKEDADEEVLAIHKRRVGELKGKLGESTTWGIRIYDESE